MYLMNEVSGGSKNHRFKPQSCFILQLLILIHFLKKFYFLSEDDLFLKLCHRSYFLCHCGQRKLRSQMEKDVEWFASSFVSYCDSNSWLSKLLYSMNLRNHSMVRFTFRLIKATMQVFTDTEGGFHSLFFGASGRDSNRNLLTFKLRVQI